MLATPSPSVGKVVDAMAAALHRRLRLERTRGHTMTSEVCPPLMAEYKYDGIRGQVHFWCENDGVNGEEGVYSGEVFSRSGLTLTHRFPTVPSIAR